MIASLNQGKCIFSQQFARHHIGFLTELADQQALLALPFKQPGYARET